MGGAKFAKNIVGLTMVFCFLGEFSYSKKDTTTKPKYENSPKNLGKICEFFHTPSVSCIKTLRRGENEKVAIF
jgi:hypothetical protein